MTLITRKPALHAIMLFAIAMLVTVGSAFVIAFAAPELDPLIQRLVAVIVLTVMALGAVAVWNRQLFSLRGAPWRLLVLPALLIVSPFFAGVKDLGAATTFVLVIGYLATGLYEEFWFRGMVLDALRSWTPIQAALLSSALFGLAHLSNIAFGANVAVTLAQVVGAACYGFGFAALRLRGTSIWILVALHAITDIALQLGDVSSAWRWGIMIGTDTLLLVYGLVILRGRTAPKGLV